MDTVDDPSHARRQYAQFISNIEAATSPSDVSQAITDLLRNRSTATRVGPHNHSVAAFERALTLNLKMTDWLADSELQRNVGRLMMVGDATETLIVLNDALKDTIRDSSRRDFLIMLFEMYVNQRLPSEILSSTQSSTPGHSDLSASEYIKILVSVPAKTAPFLKENDYRTVLLSTSYFRHLCGSILGALEHVHEEIQASRSASVSFLGRLLGKIVSVGETESAAVLFLDVCNRCTADFLWRRIAQLLFKSIPPQVHEALLVSLIPQLRPDQNLTYLLGAKLEDTNLERIMTKRLFFNRILPPPTDVLTYRNLFRYFCSMDDQGKTCKETVAHLFEAWSTVYGQKYMAVEYEISLTKALLIAVGVISSCFPPDDRYGQSILKFTMQGVEKRLPSTDPRVRRNGMLMGETVASIFQPTPEATLKFEYPEDEETAHLKSLLECRAADGNNDREKVPIWEEARTNERISGLLTEKTDAEAECERNGKGSAVEETELPDSDDDLVPHEMPSETRLRNKANISKPKYLQDCFDGLVAKDDVRRRVICLQTLPNLLRRQLDAAQQMTEAFLKVLFCMELEGSLKEALESRHEAIVQLTTMNPKTAGAYIGREAVARNYGIGVRLEMLHVLRAAAAKLVAIPRTIAPLAIHPSAVSNHEDVAVTTVATPNTKTRRIASAAKPVVSSKNRLTNVAKLYLLPLLGYGSDTKAVYAVLQMEEALFLCHLISTLGMVIHHARDLPDTPALAFQVIEFVWPFRSHSDAAVTQAVLYCISVLVQALPPGDLVTRNSKIVEDVRAFLNSVERNDPYTKSVDMAKRINTVLDITLQAAILKRSNDGSSNTPSGSSSSKPKGLTLDTIREISMASKNLSLRSTE